MQKLWNHIREPSIFFASAIGLMFLYDAYATKAWPIIIIGTSLVLFGVWHYRTQMTKMNGRVFFRAVLLGIILSIVAIVIVYQLSNRPIVMGLYQKLDALTIARLLILSPIAEELVYRQFLYGNWLSSLSPWPARMLSVLAFAIMHVPQNPMMWGFYLFGGTVLLGTYELSGKNMFASSIVHITNNVISVL